MERSRPAQGSSRTLRPVTNRTPPPQLWEERLCGVFWDVLAVATAFQVRRLRARFQVWLRAVDAPDRVVEGLALAVYEALSNVVEHAYPAGHRLPVVRVQAQWHHGHVQVVVSDQGGWRAPGAAGRHGRGLVLMRHLADVDLQPTPFGTTVFLSVLHNRNHPQLNRSGSAGSV